MLYYNTVNDLLKNSLPKLMESDVFNDFRLVGEELEGNYEV